MSLLCLQSPTLCCSMIPLTPDFLYLVMKLTFSTKDTYKQILIFFLPMLGLALFSLVPLDLLIVTTLDLPALSNVIMRNVYRLFNDRPHRERRNQCCLLFASMIVQKLTMNIFCSLVISTYIKGHINTG